MSDDEQENTPMSESPSENKFIDELTMKLLSNQNGYAKYLSKTDTMKLEEQEQFKTDCFEQKNGILSMTRHLLSHETNDFGSDVNETFNNYARILIRHLEVKQRSGLQYFRTHHRQFGQRQAPCLIGLRRHHNLLIPT